MAFPSRTLRAVCEISSGTLKISQRPPAYTHETGALDVIVDLKNGGNAYVPDASIVAGMYLFWQDTQYMSELVEMSISGCTLSGTFGDALTAMPGCPLLVVQLQDTDTGDIIVAAAAPIQITKVEGNLIVTTRPPSPSEIVYIGRSPYINTENYHWMQWNSVALAYEDTGVVAKGMPATFTATAQGLPAGSTPTATITGTAENPVINLGIPKGDTGETGATGPAAGFGTISATVDNTSGTPGVTVNTSGPDTAKNMTFAFTGLKGPQGEPGPVSQVCGVSPNAQGNVPLKGTNIPLESMSLVTVKQAIDNVGATFTGATSSTAGTKGQVPAPAAGEEGHALGGSGSWVTGSGIATSDNDATPISTSLSSLNDQIANKANAIANAHQTTYGTDLNDYTEIGMYGIESATNCPSGESGYQYGTLIVDRYLNTNYVTQIWQTVLSNKAWIRIKSNGTWSAWSELAHADQITSVINKLNSFEELLNYTDTYSTTRYIYRVGNVITALLFNDSQDAQIPGGSLTIPYSIPEKYRPKVNLVQMGISQNGTVLNFGIGSNGSVLGWIYSSGTPGQIFMNISWSVPLSSL